MKLAGLPKFVLVSTLAGVFLLVLSGCGSVAKSDNLSLTAGNWSITATSTAGNGTINIGGNVSQSGTSVTAKLSAVGSLCFDPSTPIAFSGSVSGKKVTLTSASVNGQVLTIAATGTTDSALTGTYIIAGGCANGDTGTITAGAVSSISGTWNGPIVNDFNGDPTAAISIALSQATQASQDGTFALTGTVTYTQSTCSATGTISSGSLAGSTVLNLTIDTVEYDTSAGQYSYQFASLNNVSAPTTMGGNYVGSTGICSDDNLPLTLTKQ